MVALERGGTHGAPEGSAGARPAGDESPAATRDGSTPTLCLTRRAVLAVLAAASDAERRETTIVSAPASALDADEASVEVHLRGLAAFELARHHSDGTAGATVTGEELLGLDPDEAVVLAPDPDCDE
ncbi:MAG: hypothetical protein ABEI98_08040 [Halorhabdus sp.]